MTAPAAAPALQRVAGLLHTRTDAGGVIREFSGAQRAWLGQLPGPAQPGDYLTALGQPAREHTFVVQQVQVLARASELTEAYLTAFVKGVGPAIARRVAARLGSGALDLLAAGQFPDDLPARLHAAVQEACRSRTREQVGALFLLGVHPQHCITIANAWGDTAAARFVQSPFDAMGLGIPFRVLDHAHTQLGRTPDDPARHRALVTDHLRGLAVTYGHVCQTVPAVTAYLTDHHALTDAEAAAAVTDNPQVKRYGPYVYLPHLHDTEVALAQRLVTLLRAPPAGTVHAHHPPHLSREQRRAVDLATRCGVVVLTGGPGTGKSTTVKAVADSFAQSGLPFLLAAPTGKAAARLADATGRDAHTLHRVLGAGRTGFAHGKNNPLPVQAVIVDECSMIAQDLLLALTDALSSGTRLVLVGDVRQLPPIDPGMPLGALMDTLPVAHLSTVFRQAAGSPVVQLAYDILDQAPLDFAHLPGLPFTVTDDARTAAKIALDAGAQLLTPMRKGPLGTEALNAAARTLLGKRGGLSITGGEVSAGDPVVCTKNLYDLGVLNGMTGKVLDVTEEGGGTVVAAFDHGPVTFRGAARHHLMPAYAMTVHRSQGSEWESVAVALHDSHAGMLMRTLAYTAVTRAKKHLHLLGSVTAWEAAVARQAPDRVSGLTARLND